MRFAGRLNRTEFADVIANGHDQIRAAAGQLVLHGPADWSGPRMIGSWGWTDGVLTTAGLAYGVPHGPGAWVEVVATAGPAEDWVTDQRIAAGLGAEPPGDGETYWRVVDEVRAVPPHEITVEVDGVAETFRYWPRQPMGRDRRPGWYAALPGEPGLAVVACGVEPDEIRLVTVTNVEPYLAASREHLLATYDAAQPPSDPS